MISNKFDIFQTIKNIYHTKIVPCKNYKKMLEMKKISKFDEELEYFKDKKELSDINDGLQLICNFLDNKDLYQLSLIDKYHNERIKRNEEHKMRIFKNKINDIPIYQSHIHKMGGTNINAIHYIWLKKDFTIEEKALININLLFRCEISETIKYNEKRIIFTLYDNGLICQLPSSSGMIRTNDICFKEYTFIFVFKFYSFYDDYEEYNENLENEKRRRYKKIYFLNENEKENTDEDINKEYHLVINKMLDILNKMNENNEYF